MKDYIITIDCGTTNTRVMLWNKLFVPIGVEKCEIGVRNTAVDGHNDKLKQAVRESVYALLSKYNVAFDNIEHIVAAGMITSNVGLTEIPHVVAPVSIKELADSVQTVLLSDICPVPISFVPGVKNFDSEVNLANIESMDMMRGEEVECCALISELHNGMPLLIVLPGSHTKFVSVDANGSITGCLSSIAGELLAAITNNTIIADAVGKSFVDVGCYDKTMLLAGYEHAKKTGLGRSCFSVRILNQFINKDNSKSANFLLGAVLEGDIAAIKGSEAICISPDTKVIVAGKSPLRNALVDILQSENYFQEIIDYVPSETVPLSARGAFVLIRERYKEI